MCPNTSAQGTPLMTGPQLDLTPFTTILWVSFLPRKEDTSPSHGLPDSQEQYWERQCQRLFCILGTPHQQPFPHLQGMPSCHGRDEVGQAEVAAKPLIIVF